MNKINAVLVVAFFVCLFQTALNDFAGTLEFGIGKTMLMNTLALPHQCRSPVDDAGILDLRVITRHFQGANKFARSSTCIDQTWTFLQPELIQPLIEHLVE